MMDGSKSFKNVSRNSTRGPADANNGDARAGESVSLSGQQPDTINSRRDAQPDSLQPAIRVVMMPRDANYLGTIFGGVILSSIDLAGAVEAHQHSDRKLVTAAMHEVKFIAPVFVGDLVSFYTEVAKIGRTSITVRVTVEARRAREPHESVRVTQAEVVYVAIDETGKPVPVRP
jgi:acyl-CoA thioesterase YciA